MQYKHYSFDLWLTLIESHPEHKRRRATYFFEQWNPKRSSIETVEQIVTSVDRWGNHHNEISGGCINQSFMFGMVLQQLGFEYREISRETLQQVKEEVAQIFATYHPSLLDPRLPEAFRQIRESGASINLSSNTGFACGKQLRPILDHLGIGAYFNFMVFSDEINASKPDTDFFETVWGEIQLIYNQQVNKKEVLHIGDNPFADEQGGHLFGFNTHLVEQAAQLSEQIRAI